MIKHINGWEIAKKLPSKNKVYIKRFMGAKTRCMEEYSKPFLQGFRDHFILHVVTNNRGHL